MRVVKKADRETIVCVGGDLRDVADESRLKALARDRIQDKLRGEGRVALPEVPPYQDEPVYVPRIGSGIDKLATALDAPSESGLKVLRSAAGSSQSVVDEPAAVHEAMVAIEEAGRALSSISNRR